jgi:hypothetical protein
MKKITFIPLPDIEEARYFPSEDGTFCARVGRR